MPEADVPLRITAVTVGTPINTLVVTVTASDITTPLVFNLTVSNGVASGTIKIPPGSARTIDVTALDASGNITHEGSATIDVQPGQNPPLAIKLAPRSGHVPITVTFGNFGVVVTPTTATIDASVTKQLLLTATVTGVDGKQISSPQVGWATTQPAVATVDGTGLVTGLTNGTATIVATYEGVAGLSMVNVTGIGTPPQPQPLRPTDYYVAFPPNGDLGQSASLSLSIAGSPSVKGTVAIPGLGFSTTFATDATGLAIVPLPNVAALDAWDAVEPRGVIVQSEDSVEVLAISDRPGSMAPAQVPPASILGGSHRVVSAGSGDLEGSFLALVGTADATTVTITPSVPSGPRIAGQPFQVTLNRGSAYQLEASLPYDITGSLVISDKPIGVFAGHMEAAIPGVPCCAGMIWTAIPPTSIVRGQWFVAVPLAQRTRYWLKILALSPNTHVNAEGVAGLSVTLQEGQSTQASTTTGAEIRSDSPIIVAQMAESREADGYPPLEQNPGSDPCLALLRPINVSASHEHVFATPTDQVGSRHANIVAPNSDLGSLTLNGNAIDVSNFRPIGSGVYSGGSTPLSVGINRLASSGTSLGVTIYGWDSWNLGEGANGFCFSPGDNY